ncbi:MAG: hypothetical protein DWQ19_12655 [Crenarchaeota archaeon]|nr:MAG: hypothetical protein DWQ19_12655 [Thermoproteota archaeon]
MIKLEFKNWLERHYPTQMYPANRAGMRDVRFGYALNQTETPPVIANVGSDFITGMGQVFRKSMGTAYPVFGSGYRNYFDKLTATVQDGKDFIVVREQPYDESEDEHDPQRRRLHKTTKEALKKIRSMPDVVEASQNAGVDIQDVPDILYEPSNKEGHIKILFRFKLEDKLTDRLRLTTRATQNSQNPQNQS